MKLKKIKRGLVDMTDNLMVVIMGIIFFVILSVSVIIQQIFFK